MCNIRDVMLDFSALFLGKEAAYFISELAA